MASDIVERLRDYRGGDVGVWKAMEAAADEIERLRAALGKADACIVVGAKDQARAVIRAALAEEKKG